MPVMSDQTATIEREPAQAAAGAESLLADSPSSDGGGFTVVNRGGPRRRHRVNASKAEIRQRVKECMALIMQGESSADILMLMQSKYNVSSSTSERYLRAARESFVEDSGLSKEEFRAINLKAYRKLAGGTAVIDRDKIKALERIDKIVGLESPVPRQVEVSGPGGGPIQSTSAVVVCGVDLSGKLGEVGAQIRKAALATLIETIQADPKTLAAMPAGSVTVENVPETVDASPLPVES